MAREVSFVVRCVNLPGLLSQNVNWEPQGQILNSQPDMLPGEGEYVLFGRVPHRGHLALNYQAGPGLWQDHLESREFDAKHGGAYCWDIRHNMLTQDNHPATAEAGPPLSARFDLSGANPLALGLAAGVGVVLLSRRQLTRRWQRGKWQRKLFR